MKTLTLLILIIAVSAGYWFAIRPSMIRKECNQWAVGEEKRQIDLVFERASRGELSLDLKEYETLYNQCLREKGL